jgi:uncharacterized flavoprotein (TIGR03862 family)
LLIEGYEVDLYDQSTGLAKKFLIAGNGGLNLTHSEDLNRFSQRYTHNEEFFSELLNEFSPADLRAFCEELGVETFVGTSGRVFPKNLKAAEILLKWTKSLKEHPRFNLHLKHSLIAMSKDKELTFIMPDGEVKIKAKIVIMATGGASWSKTGSDGKWKNITDKLQIDSNEFKPMNCGFETKWTEHLVSKLDRAPVKNIGLSIGSYSSRGEVMITPYGIEGGAIYAISNFIRDEIYLNKAAIIEIDLKPDLSLEQVSGKLSSKKSKDSLANHLRKSLNLDKVAITLLNEVSRNRNENITAELIKALPIKLHNIRPIDEAISTSGGVRFNGLTDHFESKEIKGLYFAGEMLDFEAPTGGYLLQGCFSTANRVVNGITS